MMQIIMQILNYSLITSFGLSTLMTVVNNSSSNSRIKRKGYEIKPINNNSVIENIKYLMKDYLFLVVPFYNLIHSIKQTAKKDAEFDSQRIEMLTDRDRLVKVESKKDTKSSKEETRKVENRDESRKPSRVEPKVESKKRDSKSETEEKTLDEMNCYERREYYRNEYNDLLALRNRAKQTGISVQILNTISHEMQSVVDEYNKANRECKIEDLKAQKNIILSSMEEPAKLIRK